MRKTRTIVIGAGIGGLVAALALAARGLDVTVLERADGPGGKMRPLIVDGAPIDAGPTVFTMRFVFDAILQDLGLTLDDHLELRPLTILARHAWASGDRLDLLADMEANAEAIARFASPADAQGYRDFCRRAGRIFGTLRDSFITASRPDPLTLAWRIGLGRAGDLLGISPFAKLWSELAKHFRDPRLIQLFGRYATYCGSSPFSAPATLMLIAHVEQQGVWQIAGGMRRLASFLEETARLRGVSFRYGAHVDRILVEFGRASGVMLAGGEELRAEAIVFNGDAAALGHALLGRPASRAVRRTPKTARSLSAVTWAMRAPTQGFPLAHHNVFFGEPYASEFGDIFARGRLPGRPTVYVCAQDRSDDAPPAGGAHERLLCLVNAPACGDGPTLQDRDIATCETEAFRLLQRCGLTIQRQNRAEIRRTPAEFAALFPGTGGALYGRSSHGWMASFLRPGSRTRLRGLYLAGGSTHPGPGVPMAALSGRLAASSLLADLDLTGRFVKAAMPGGTSMHSMPKAGSG